MFELIKFKREHLDSIVEESINAGIDRSLGGALEESDSVTFLKNGRVQVCGGISEIWSGRGILWAVFSRDSKQDFLPTFRAIKRWLREMQATKYPRIELSVDLNVPIATRRAEMLGFKLECPLARKFLPNGSDCALYAMVRE